MSDQKQTVEASLIQNFWQHVSTLTSLEAQYQNYLVFFDAQSKSGNDLLLEEADKQSFNKLIQETRYQVQLCYVYYKSISTALNKLVELTEEQKNLYETFDKLKKKLFSTFTFEQSELEDYVLILNGYVAKNIAVDSFKSSKESAIDAYNQSLSYEPARN